MSKTNLPSLFLLTLLLFSAQLSLSSAKCNQEDRKVLVKLRDHFSAVIDSAFWGWNSFFDCCNWGGVGCNQDGRVVSLSIALNPLLFPKSVVIPSFIEDLTLLKSLKLSSPAFGEIVGPIPRAIAHLYDLEHLDLSQNKLTGTIPGFIGQLEGLNYIDLSDNQFSGEVTETLGFLTKLTILKLNKNKLNGSIPLNFNQMESLQYLDLSNNKFSGPISETLSRLSKLSHIDFHDNQLNGTIPNELGEKLPLEYFDVSNNQLCGKIPPNLARFDKCRFKGNKCLCGYPLNQQCKRNLDMSKMEKYAAELLSFAA